MNRKQFEDRTKRFALDVVRLVESLPGGRTASVVGRQLLRSGTSVGANYRSACRAKSHADFISKLTTALEEADETAYWLELARESGLTSGDQVGSLQREANELTAMLAASVKTARERRT